MAAEIFLQTILSVSEKAATIARVIRSDHRLFQMLIEEKTGENSNKRFVQDFKTLADVLIQETIKHDIGKQFPQMVDNIKGEESNKFTNTVGESIHVKVEDTEAETCDLLVSVLNGDVAAAKILAQTVHSSVELDVLSADHKDNLSKLNFSTDNLGIWIDPIDGTSEYIHGKQDVSMSHDIYPHGLQCCTVLIGAYDISTGIPIMGVVNQPFESFDNHSNSWKGKTFWGISTPEANISSIKTSSGKKSQTIVVISSSESLRLKQHLSDCGFLVLYSSGAGYKLLCVALGLADIYLLSQASTYKWDTCGPHSLLCSLGGGIIDYSQAVSGCMTSICYHEANEHAAGIGMWCNGGGMIAYINRSVFDDFVKNII